MPFKETPPLTRLMLAPVTCEPGEARIEALAQADLRDLASFARGRLRYVGLSLDEADDLVQNAIRSVLLGLVTKRHGRRPRLIDIESHGDFIRYLKAVICSGAEAFNRRESRIYRSELTETSVIHPAHFVEEFIRRDFSAQLFRRLEQSTPERLRPVVENWKATWEDSDIIPIGDHHRRARQKIRALAASIAKQIVV